MKRIELLLFIFLPFLCFGQTECFDPSADCTFFGSVEFEIERPVTCGDTIELLPTEQLCNTWDIPDDLNFEFGIGSDSSSVYVVIDRCFNDSIIVDGITNTPSGSGIASCNTSFIYTFSPVIDTILQEIPCEDFYALVSESELSQGECGCDSLRINFTTDFTNCIPCNQQCIFIKGELTIEDGSTTGAEVIVTYQLNGETLTATRTNWLGRTEELLCFNIEDNLIVLNIQSTLPSGINGSVSAETWIDNNTGIVSMTNIFMETCHPNEVGIVMDTLVASTGCDSILITTTELITLPELTVGDQQVCIGETITLQAIINHDVTFEWNTGEFTSEIKITNEGIYTLTVTDEDGCTATTTAEAIFKDIELELFASVADPFLLNELPLEVWQGSAVEMSVHVSGTLFPYEILWDKGPEVGDSIYHYIANQSGELTVAVIDSIGCIATQTIEIIVRPIAIYVPNAFSPNEDNNNDFLNIYTSPNVEEIRLQFFSRTGSLVFDEALLISEQNNEGIEWRGWDGLFKNKQLTPQVFVYLLRYRAIRGEWAFITGDVVLIKK